MLLCLNGMPVNSNYRTMLCFVLQWIYNVLLLHHIILHRIVSYYMIYCCVAICYDSIYIFCSHHITLFEGVCVKYRNPDPAMGNPGSFLHRMLRFRWIRTKALWGSQILFYKDFCSFWVVSYLLATSTIERHIGWTRPGQCEIWVGSCFGFVRSMCHIRWGLEVNGRSQG